MDIDSMGPVIFKSRAVTTASNGEPVTEHLVEASVPRAGGDSAVLAVFDSKEAADLLAAVLQHASDSYGQTAAYRNSLDRVFV